MLLTGLLTMHGLATDGINTAGGTTACPGGSAVLPTSEPDSSGETAPVSVRVGAEPATAAAPGAAAAPGTEMEMSGESCVATLPRQAAAVSPLMLGFVVLVALGASAGSAHAPGRGRPETWRGPPSPGIDVLRLKCVLRT
ncbi:hypothetical protein EF834_11875 [Rhodococcus spongiicola]|uniref:Uncharacterized protein n=1 Tax=Rhodococcus spongiicola TaxID=2487352 RepID=A0A3S3BIU1_9NOCA|nr:hypothetical protein EF834_11875 [Rhodococcus spongiicola]